MTRKNTVYILMTAITKLPKTLPIAAEVVKTFTMRLKSKGMRVALMYLRYYFTNLFVSFGNCHFNSSRVECPCCGWRGYDFIPLDGVIFQALRMVCPVCLAYDRHRAFFLYVTQHDERLLHTTGTTLHIAPETYVEALARKNNAHRYLITDLDASNLKNAPTSAFQSDIQCLPLPDESVDTIICFHVLEHIANDRAAVAELHRTLSSDGVAYIMVPMTLSAPKTWYFQEPNKEIFDHYWAPGRDYQEHLSAFQRCDAISPTDYLTEDEAFRYGTPPREIIFVCTKHT